MYGSIDIGATPQTMEYTAYSGRPAEKNGNLSRADAFISVMFFNAVNNPIFSTCLCHCHAASHHCSCKALT